MKNCRQPRLYLIALIGGLFAAQPAARAALATCNNGMRIQSMTQATFITPPPSGVGPSQYRYAITALVANESYTDALGYAIEATTIGGLATTNFSSSKPMIGPKRTTLLVVRIAETSVPVPGAPYSRNHNGLVSVANSEFANTVVFKYCTPYTDSDLVFTAKAGRSYIIQRSASLASWENVQTLQPTADEEVWRAHFLMRSSPESTNEFYRVKAVCTDGTDCETEHLRLNESVNFMRKKYKR